MMRSVIIQTVLLFLKNTLGDFSMNLSTSTINPAKTSPFSSYGCADCYRFMGAHPEGDGWRFRVWAPHAEEVFLVGSFNGWQVGETPMTAEPGGLWTVTVPGLAQYDVYQYAIRTQEGELLYKSDPFAFHCETRPSSASKLFDLSSYQWGDQNWQAYRQRMAGKKAPMNLYEVHVGSWRRTGDGQVLNYRDIAHHLVPYVKEMGYTAVKLLPVGEHPLDESLGYQLTGYFAVTSRFGTPTDFQFLVDQLHQAGVAVIVDGNVAEYPGDGYGLYLFDGSPCFGIEKQVPVEAPAEADEEDASPAEEKEPLYRTDELCQFDFSRIEVQNFLLSAAFFWFDQLHVDGIHFTGVPAGGNAFLSSIIHRVHQEFPYAKTFSSVNAADFDHCWYTSWVSRMLDRLTDGERKDSVFAVATRPAWNCILPLSHDLVAAPNPSIAARMLGDDDRKFAQVRAFYLFFLTQPGSKMTMMGTEFGQWASWNCLQSLDWHLLQYDFYQRQQRFFREANHLYLSTPAFWECDDIYECFRIIKNGEGDQITAYSRHDKSGQAYLIAANFSTAGLSHCWLDVPCAGRYEVIFSTEDASFGGQSGVSSSGVLRTQMGPSGSGLWLTLPPMSALVLKCVKRNPELFPL